MRESEACSQSFFFPPSLSLAPLPPPRANACPSVLTLYAQQPTSPTTCWCTELCSRKPPGTCEQGGGSTGAQQQCSCVCAGAGGVTGHAVCRTRRYKCTRRYTQPTVTIRLKVFHAHSPPCQSPTPIRQPTHPCTALQCLPLHPPLALRPTRRLLPARGEGAVATVRGA